MNFCPKVKEHYKDKLPAVTHVDGTARVQTITKEQNPLVYDLLVLFKQRTGIGVLVNTSFNVDGKPILSTYKDAFKVFDETQLDRLYLDGYYFCK
jgi:carbamoyltransferase